MQAQAQSPTNGQPDIAKEFPVVVFVPQLATILGVAESTVYNHKYLKRFPDLQWVKIGRKLGVTRDSLVTLLRSCGAA